MTIVTVGIDRAKNLFALLGVDGSGKPALARPEIARAMRRLGRITNAGQSFVMPV